MQCNFVIIHLSSFMNPNYNVKNASTIIFPLLKTCKILFPKNSPLPLTHFKCVTPEESSDVQIQKDGRFFYLIQITPCSSGTINQSKKKKKNKVIQFSFQTP